MASKKKPKRAKRPRTLRREKLREVDKVGRVRRKLQALEPGGDADHPIEVASTSQIDAVARRLECARCAATLFIEHEVADVRAGRVIRRVELVCRQCGEERTAFFALTATPTLH